MLAGALVGVVFAVCAVVLRRDQIIVGTALTMLCLGITGTLFRARDMGLAALVDTDAVVRVPVLSAIPIIGGALFAQPLVTYTAVALVPAAWWVLNRTHAGLALRAVGESPAAARAAGIRVRTTQACAVIIGSTLGGLAGGALVLAQAGTFAEGMSAGRGFLAIAIVALGRWRPVGVALAAVVFGAAMALQFVVQALGWTLRYELVLMIPYALTLVALGAFGKGSAPAMLGRAVERD
jgi:simple sugar transport system permease protein